MHPTKKARLFGCMEALNLRAWMRVAVRVVGCWLILVTGAFADGPNILLVMTDDQGFGDVAVHGDRVTQTGPELSLVWTG